MSEKREPSTADMAQWHREMADHHKRVASNHLRRAEELEQASEPVCDCGERRPGFVNATLDNPRSDCPVHGRKRYATEGHQGRVVCMDCGVLVSDTERHTAFHAFHRMFA